MAKYQKSLIAIAGGMMALGAAWDAWPQSSAPPPAPAFPANTSFLERMLFDLVLAPDTPCYLKNEYPSELSGTKDQKVLAVICEIAEKPENRTEGGGKANPNSPSAPPPPPPPPKEAAPEKDSSGNLIL